MKAYNLMCFALSALSFTACSDGLKEDLKDVNVTVEANEQVAYDGQTITVKRGTPVKFNITGEPDNITFFSGETGHNFDYRNRTTIDPSLIESSKLTVKIYAQYGSAYKDLFSMYVSDEFPGLYKNDFGADCQLVKDFGTWKDWVPADELPKKAGEKVFKEMDLTSYLGKNMTLAIHVHPHDASTIQPKLNFSQVKISNVLKNGVKTEIFASSMGFTPVNVWSSDLTDITIDPNLKKNPGYYNSNGELIESALWYGTVTNNIWGMWNLKETANGSFYVQSVAEKKGVRESWLVSDYLVINACTPDKGEPLKDMTSRFNSYEYTYNQVGTYKATFYVTNANYKHEEAKVITMVIDVK